MKYLLFLSCFMYLATSAQAQSGTITSGSINFTFVDRDVKGSVSGFESTSKIDEESLENSVIEGYVLSETLKTGNFIRDWHLKGGSYFDVDSFPKILFKSSTIKLNGDEIIVNGVLTLKGISKPMEIIFLKVDKKLQGTTTLFTTDFDITISKKSRDKNKVVVNLLLSLD